MLASFLRREESQTDHLLVRFQKMNKIEISRGNESLRVGTELSWVENRPNFESIP